MISALLTVKLGNRSEQDFRRALGIIKRYGFRWNKTADRFQRYIAEEHAHRLIRELKDEGIRAIKV